MAFLGLLTTMSVPGPVHSPAGPGPIIRVQIWTWTQTFGVQFGPDLGPPGPGLDFGQSGYI